MLQINKFLLIILFLCFYVPIGAMNFADTIDWVMEGALEEEFFKLEITEILSRDDFKNASDFYKDGEYRQAVAILEKMMKLHMPDNRADFVGFMAAECFRKLNMEDNATKAYWYVIEEFPHSSKVAPSYFRLLQYAYKNQDGDIADKIHIMFEKKHKMHPLFNSVQYVIGKLYFHMERYGEAGTLLLKVPKKSSRHFQAQYLASLSFIQLQDVDKSLIMLNYINKNSTNEKLAREANIVIADIYFSRENYSIALPLLSKVKKGEKWYDYARVKMARIYLKKKMYDEARNIARSFVNKGRKVAYFFEMASVLEQVYKAKDEKVRAAKVKRLVNEQNIYARLSFELTEELIKVYSISHSWKNIEFDAIRQQNDKLAKDCQKNIRQLNNLKKKCRSVLYEIGAIGQKDIEEGVRGLAQQRYVSLLRKDISTIKDTVKIVKEEIFLWSAMEKDSVLDSLEKKTYKDQKTWADSVSVVLDDREHEYVLLKKMFMETGNDAERFGREMQAKYVDWSFMRYQEKKKQLGDVTRKIADKKRMLSDSSSDSGFVSDSTKIRDLSLAVDASDSTDPPDSMGLSYSDAEVENIIKSITNDRIRLIEHVETLLDASPGSNYNPQVLYRLAELYFDEATDDFNRRLEEYEKLIEEDGDSVDIAFPEYDLDKTIETYHIIETNYPKDPLADDALFFKALAFKKIGLEREANFDFEYLVEHLPESEYFVEANMNIGNYYFNHPKVKNNTGYKWAEEAYRRVLVFKNHPQFVHAIYHLGWCYYMQDQYEEAISVFKYLVEEGKLDFNATDMENKQILNPLMREEAIDYIAISFDEKNDLDGAAKFLKLIGNLDYAAKVFIRIGELREEDLDLEAAVNVYHRLLKDYAMSSVAPDAAQSLIKVFESNQRHAQAMKEREEFFKNYAQGTKWHTENMDRDSIKVMAVDSMTIAIGLYVADELYRDAEENGNGELYKRAMKNYARLVKAYPDNPIASEALWNLAIILDTKLFKKKKAYGTYLAYSKLQKADPERREQAALNAVSIAQSMLPVDIVDSLLKMDTMDVVSVKVVEAAQNYLELFPDGKSFYDVVMNLGSIYFNRKNYSDAMDVYRRITKKGSKTPRYYDAGFLISKCYFGQSDWSKASGGFEKIWKESPDELQKNDAYKLLLQSKFLYAKGLLAAGDFDKAAKEYINIDRKYPGSEYSDVVLFNAAEAYEKNKKWAKSCDTYFELFRKYPDSKLATDALFNAASNYDKIKNYTKTAQMYEYIVENYPESDKAKDALFNVGFAYEKIGSLKKMADANDRYSRLYPGEKDVEVMMIRSANFYYKSGMYEKAITVYRNYITRYSKKPHAVEANYMIGKCYLGLKDRPSAIEAFEFAEMQNKRLAKSGVPANNFHAAEAAYSMAKLKHEDFSAIDFDVPKDILKEKQKIKTDALTIAVNAYQRVMKYKSKQMFEAAFRIGEMYEEYARSWKMQRLENMNAMETAVAKKDIHFASSKMMKQSFSPFSKVIELSKLIDTLTPEQKKWVDSSQARLGKNYIEAGKYMIIGIAAMQKAPIPKEIQEKPLYLFQYKKQLLETMEPLKADVRNYYKNSYRVLKKMAISDEITNSCLNKFSHINYLIPNEFDRLAENILSTSENLPKDMGEDEREELVFQFEDIVFEIQDKALFSYEDAFELAKEEGHTDSKWYMKIFERLARLSPETYGKTFYSTVTFETDYSWIVHKDSVNYWNKKDPFASGWEQIYIVSGKKQPSFPVGNPEYVWGHDSCSRNFFWKNTFLSGVPREATLYYSCKAKFKLYLNGKFLIGDTSETRSKNQIDSITGINSMLKGGDNIIAIDAFSEDILNRGIAIVLSVLVDTSQTFTSSATMPAVKMVRKKTIVKKVSPKKISDAQDAAESKTQISSKEQFKNRGELQKVIATLVKKRGDTDQNIRKERLEVQKLNIKMDSVSDRIENMKKEIEELKTQNDK